MSASEVKVVKVMPINFPIISSFLGLALCDRSGRIKKSLFDLDQII